MMKARLVPEIQRNAMAGFVQWHAAPSTAALFERSALAVDIVIDVLTDRGFSVSHERRIESIPTRFDAATGDIHCRRFAWHVFRITFPGGTVRDVKQLHGEASARCAHAEGVPVPVKCAGQLKDHSPSVPQPRAARSLGAGTHWHTRRKKREACLVRVEGAWGVSCKQT